MTDNLAGCGEMCFQKWKSQLKHPVIILEIGMLDKDNKNVGEEVEETESILLLGGPESTYLGAPHLKRPWLRGKVYLYLNRTILYFR